jgi:two-component system LytT family response regulator
MIKVVIVEDVAKSADLLKNMIASLFDENDVNTIGCASNIQSAVEIIQKEKPQLIFLDINLGNEIGFEILKHTNPDNFEIIVTTAHSEHALQAIKCSVADFLLKPYNFEDLRTAIAKAKERLSLKNLKKTPQLINAVDSGKISISTQDGLKLIPVAEIVYVEADSNYSEFHMINKTKVVSSKSLIVYEEMLQNQNFLRTHKSYLVNMKHIVEYQKGSGGRIFMCNGAWLPVSRQKKQDVLDFLMT